MSCAFYAFNGPCKGLLDQHKLNPLVSPANETVRELPIDMRFNDGHVISIVVYSMLMIFSAVSNVTVLVTILRPPFFCCALSSFFPAQCVVTCFFHRNLFTLYSFCNQRRCSRISLFLLHLGIADHPATFLLMALEVRF